MLCGTQGQGRAVWLAAAVAGIALLGGWLAAGRSSAGVPAGLGLNQIGSFDSPVYVDNAPGFKRLLFVVEQPGRIAVLRGSHRVGRDFLDIEKRVLFSGEQGLLSVAFPPDYRQSRRFYVYYTNEDGNNEVDEFKRLREHPTRASAHSRRRVLLIRHPGETNHNGGQLQFGPDGRLYIGTGDGGGGDDVHDNARHLDKLLGKLLRINPRKHGKRNHTVPASNPYVGKPGRDEIYSYGLRNPWRFSFDGKRLVVGDVGQGTEEEVDYETLAGARGANFGWPEYEGDSLHDPTRPGPDPPTDPIFTYPTHAGGTCAITGGYVVKSPGLSALEGRYVYGDFCAGYIHSLVPALDGASDDQDTGLDASQLSSFGEGRHGHIYVVSLDGPVYRLVQG
jgi:glucose/arabinose dehydrogenase